MEDQRWDANQEELLIEALDIISAVMRRDFSKAAGLVEEKIIFGVDAIIHVPLKDLWYRTINQSVEFQTEEDPVFLWIKSVVLLENWSIGNLASLQLRQLMSA